MGVGGEVQGIRTFLLAVCPSYVVLDPTAERNRNLLCFTHSPTISLATYTFEYLMRILALTFNLLRRASFICF